MPRLEDSYAINALDQGEQQQERKQPECDSDDVHDRDPRSATVKAP
jgi:hypothetical protein